ncbi:MAG TPA: biliverdin-producing heme oxygenase, partial [Longimicrobiaceae bacterium]|nr:biliverdin-producing heme oxygenase [Longimicrobiaceae bacterium]
MAREWQKGSIPTERPPRDGCGPCVPPSDFSGVTILAALKEQTREHHERVEAHAGVMDPGLTLPGYRALLARFRGFYLPVEERLCAMDAWGALALDAEVRRKLPLLDADLAALGLSQVQIAALPACPRPPALDDVPRALGGLYVLEGATLGGAIISRSLVARLGVGRAGGGAFFGSYGERLGAMWKQFGTALEAWAERHSRSEAHVTGGA